MLKKLLERISIPTPKHLKSEPRKRVLMRRYLAAVLCGCMMVPTIGSIAMATEETASVCPNHQEHDETCGYDANGECSHVCPECTLVAGVLEANMNENISEADESSSTDATDDAPTDANSDAVDLLDDINISDTDVNPVDDTEVNTDTEADESTDVNTDLETADDMIQPAATNDDAAIQPYTDSFPADGLNDIIVRAISNWNYVVSGETAEGETPHLFKLETDLSKDGVLDKEALLAKLPAKISANFTVTDESTEGAGQPQELDIAWDLSVIPDTPTEEIYTISATAKGYGFQDGDAPQAEIKLIPQAYGVELNGKVYDTLQGAIDKAVKGNTITFLSDLTEHVNVPKSITIDLNGHTLTSDSGAAITISEYLTYFTVRNGTIQAATGCNAIYSETQNSKKPHFAATLTLDSVVFTGATKAINYECTLSNVPAVIIKNCIFNANDQAICLGTKSGNSKTVLKIENTKFTNNNSSNNYYGVICAQNVNELSLDGCEFSDNILATNVDSGSSAVAQIYIGYRGSTLSIHNTTFSNNKGCYTIYAANCKDILLDDVTATNNITDYNRKYTGNGGGLLCAKSVQGNIILKNVTAEGNSVAYGSGGAVLITGTATSPAISMENCTFERNIAGSEKTTNEGNGGAVSVTGNFASLTMSGCTVNGNESKGTANYDYTGGGGVYIYRDSGSNTAPVAITNCTIQGNTAARIGGGIYAGSKCTRSGKWGAYVYTASNPVNANIDACTISGNTAMRGGGLWVRALGTAIKDTTINGNTANMSMTAVSPSTSSLPGGGIYAEILKDAVVNLTGSTHVYNNQTPNERVYAVGTNKGISSDIFLGSTSTSPMTLNIDPGVLEPYQTGESTYTLTDSGAISTTALKGYYSATIRPTGVYFDTQERKHPAEGDIVVNTLAGAVKAARDADQNKVYICSTVNPDDPKNSTQKPVNLTQEIADIMNKNSDITFVRCEDHGTNCAMFSMRGSVNVTLDGAHIDGQKIQSSGSLISISAGGSLTVTGNTIIENGYTTGNGGAISLSQSSLTMTGGEIRNNFAKGSGGKPGGGGIYAYSNSNGSGLTFEGGKISNNRTDQYGGGVFIGYAPSNFGVSGGKTIFDGNTAKMGGGVYFENETHHIYRAEFTNNTATRESLGAYYCGGGIYIETGTNVYMKNVYIADNVSTKIGVEPRGGGLGICPTGATVILDSDGMLSVNNGCSDISMNLAQTHLLDVLDDGWINNIQKPIVDDAALLLSEYALGGGQISYEKYVEKQLVPLDRKYIDSGISGTGAYKTIASAQTVQWAREQAEANGVIVTGNKAQLIGSGIMTNGNLIIGTDRTSIGIQKNWYDIDLKKFITDEKKLPAQLIVHLMRKNSQGEWEMVDESARSDAIVALNEKNGWFYHWGNLGVTAEWGVAEVSPEGWKLIDVKNALDATPDSYTFWPMVSKETTIKLNILNNYGRIEKIVTENKDGTGAVTGYISAVYAGDRVLDSTSGTYVPAEKTTYYLWNIDGTGKLLTYVGETEMKEPARTGSKELPFLSMTDLSQITRGNLNNYGHIIKIFNQDDISKNQDDISKNQDDISKFHAYVAVYQGEYVENSQPSASGILAVDMRKKLAFGMNGIAAFGADSNGDATPVPATSVTDVSFDSYGKATGTSDADPLDYINAIADTFGMSFEKQAHGFKDKNKEFAFEVTFKLIPLTAEPVVIENGEMDTNDTGDIVNTNNSNREKNIRHCMPPTYVITDAEGKAGNITKLQIKPGADGVTEVTLPIKLKDGEKVTFNGLLEGDTYTIEETTKDEDICETYIDGVKGTVTASDQTISRERVEYLSEPANFKAGQPTIQSNIIAGSEKTHTIFHHRFDNISHIRVEKEWIGDQVQKGESFPRPESIDVTIKRENADGKKGVSFPDITLTSPDWKKELNNMPTHYMDWRGYSDELAQGEVSGINVKPYQYKVEENPVPKDYVDSYKNTTADDGTVRITNTRVGTLTIKKEVVDPEETAISDDTKFKFEVTLTLPEGVLTNEELEQSEVTKTYPCTYTKDGKAIEGRSTDITFTFVPNRATKTATGTAIVELFSGEIVTIKALPRSDNGGISYTVKETGASVPNVSVDSTISEKQLKGYKTTATQNDGKDEDPVNPFLDRTVNGEIPKDRASQVTFKNKTASLSVTKTVQDEKGNPNDKDKTNFKFSVTLTPPEGVALKSSYIYKITDASNAVVQDENSKKERNLSITDNCGTFTLQHDQTATIYGLPIGTKYTVKEENSAGYDVSVKVGSEQEQKSVQSEGTLEADNKVKVEFINKKIKQEPETVTLTVKKEWLDTDKTTPITENLPEFITVKVLQDNAEWQTVTLNAANGWQHTWSDLAKGHVYTAEEVTVPTGYTLLQTPVSGTNDANGNVTITLTNIRTSNIPGNLVITKIVSGNRSSPQRDFTFTVILRDANKNLLTDPYDYTGSTILEGATPPSNGTLTADEQGRRQFSLRHGQAITISGLPAGTTYKVSEEAGNYSPTISNDSGTIPGGGTITAAFENYRNGDRRRPTPDTEIDEPPTPQVYYPGEEPDPNEPDSPDEITIVEEDVPQTYIKTWDPENEEYVYIPEEPTPLAPITPFARLDTTPKTDDPNHPWFWLGLCFASILGIGLLKPRKNKEDE